MLVVAQEIRDLLRAPAIYCLPMRKRKEHSAFLDIKQFAALVAVSADSVRRRVADDPDFPQPVRVGKLMRWRREAIAAWAERAERISRRQVKR